jgi:hypothetical protein
MVPGFCERLVDYFSIFVAKMNILTILILKGGKELRKFYLPITMFLVLIIYFLPDSPKASEDQLDNREKVFQFLESAFQAQLSLSEKDRTIEEIEAVLSPYFTKQYQEEFLKLNLHEGNGKYFTYGTDFGQLYIPFFAFSKNTKMVIEEEKIYVFEYFPKNLQGPVGYESHYEGLLIDKIEEQWKVSRYLIDQIPDRIIRKALYGPNDVLASDSN